MRDEFWWEICVKELPSIQASDRPYLTGIVDCLLMYVGVEKKGNEELVAAQKDLELKFAGGFPELFYHKIQFLPIYAAAGNLYRRGLLDIASGKVCGFALLHCFDANYKGCCNDPISLSGSCCWLRIRPRRTLQPDGRYSIRNAASSGHPRMLQICW